MTQKPWQPSSNNNHQPRSQSGVMSVQDIMEIYAFLDTIANPSEKINTAKDKIETVILAFANSLGNQQ